MKNGVKGMLHETSPRFFVGLVLLISLSEFVNREGGL
jgi:hypothetical protein